MYRLTYQFNCDEPLASLVQRANDRMKEEASKPRGNSEGLVAQIATSRVYIDKLNSAIAGQPTEFLESIVAQIQAEERQLRELQTQFREIESKNRELPPPLTLSDIEVLAEDLRTVLNQSPTVAAPILRRLTGPILNIGD